MTLNSPQSLIELFNVASSSSKDKKEAIQIVELMREVGLKCIGFNGVPRTINSLGAFRNSLPGDIISELNTKPTRVASSTNINSILARGQALWKSIYAPFETKLVDKLADSHPDLPVFIINHEYGALFADPDENGHVRGAKIGRVLTSITAVACLRAQTGVGPQVISHVFGLRKAYEDSTYKSRGEFEVEGGHWLASDEGNMWLVKSVDSIVEALGEGRGSNFAPGMSKL